MMSDVRAELLKVIEPNYANARAWDGLADAILERFEVTPKPVVTARSLGELMHKALERSDVRPGWAGVDVQGLNFDSVAVKVLDQLDAAGLKIVRVEDE